MRRLVLMCLVKRSQGKIAEPHKEAKEKEAKRKQAAERRNQKLKEKKAEAAAKK